METSRRAVTFVVRLSGTESEEWLGVVERVRTGEKHRFRSVDDLGALIARMARAADREADPGAPRPDTADREEKDHDHLDP